MSSSVDQVRSFNRIVTLRVGALDDSYLGRGRPLGQARLLSEIARDGGDMRLLRERLGLDSGYFSRLVQSLRKQGLITLKQHAGDRRRRDIALTQQGQAEHAAYEQLSDELAVSMIEPLNPSQQERLLAAMAEVESLLTAAAVTIGCERIGGDAAKFCLTQYFRELAERFEGGFDAARAQAEKDNSMAPPTGCFLVVRLFGRPIGCGGLRSLASGTGEIKRMWVAPEARGLGVARRLLAALEDKAVDLGMHAVRLDTNRALAQAQSLYRKAGYHAIERFNDNPYADFWFEKRLGGDPGQLPGKSSPISR
ncbi:MAG: MarR family transcriptional regulator [Rhizobiaceae bacterium]|nr:MarR family transcriptional regulator [Rhizobiaceae bacterium]